MKVYILYGIRWDTVFDPTDTLGVYSSYEKALLAGNRWFHNYSQWKFDEDLRNAKIKEMHDNSPGLKKLKFRDLEPIVLNVAGPYVPMPERTWQHNFDTLEIEELEVDSE
jgi:hypothetical protein